MARVCIDVNVVSRDASTDVEEFESVASEVGVDLWVTSERSRADDPDRPDQILVTASARSTVVHPVPVLVPPVGTANALERVIGIAECDGLRVMRLCPTGHRYPLVDWVLSPIPELCERYGLALLVDFAPRPIPWTETVTFARHYPSVPIVVLDCDPVSDRSAPAALDAALNLILQIVPTGGVASLTEIFGAHRFVAGSSTGSPPTREKLRAYAHDELARELAPTAQALGDGTYARAHF